MYGNLKSVQIIALNLHTFVSSRYWQAVFCTVYATGIAIQISVHACTIMISQCHASNTHFSSGGNDTVDSDGSGDQNGMYV